ncbi:MAG: sigma-70 family RNA polymerase sigma factor [Myxococcales bacterium]|nr:MAG: sigma-70 family RNA polymerase sigma factor [Myxococcales bacterium]
MSKNINNNRNKFEAEIDPYLEPLYGMALRFTKNAADAEDLLQDVMLKAYRAYDRFDGERHVKAWLFRILTNTYINQYRRKKRERMLSEDGSSIMGAGLISGATLEWLSSPFDAASRPIINQEIRFAVDQLPEEQRLVLLLADMEGLSYRQIADAVDAPLGTIMSRLHRARASIQQHLVVQAEEMGLVKQAKTATDSSAENCFPMAAYRKRKEEAS